MALPARADGQHAAAAVALRAAGAAPIRFVSRLSYDFVVCRLDGIPLAAIEIDDATHALPERQEADNRKNKATEAAGVAMIRWQVGETPDIREIRRLIQKIDKKAA